MQERYEPALALRPAASQRPAGGASPGSPGTAGALASNELALKDVRKVFRNDVMRGPQIALHGLTCVFASGACTGLLGHNGAGKTTTIRLILGILKPDSGTITLGGEPLTTETKRRIGFMPEINKLPAVLTVHEVLDVHLQLFAPEHAATAATRRTAISAALEAVGLAEQTKKRVGHLSKGMARRLAWAQATIHRPQLLILDEPASGLDPLGRRHMLHWIEGEKKRGTTIVLCTHELAQILSLCEAYHVLRKGTLEASGSLTAREAQAYAVQVSGLNEESLKRLAASEGLPPWRGVYQEGALAELSFSAYEPCAHWLQFLLAKGFIVTRCGEDTRAFEEELLSHFVGGS